MSSPSFVRVADASAASSASKMISLSTPFSFDTFSTTVRISLFILYPPGAREYSVRRQVRLAYARDRQHPPPSIHLDLHRLAASRAQRPLVPTPSIERLGELHVDVLAHEPRKLSRGAKGPLEPWRRHLERVVTRHWVALVEDPAYRAAHPLAVIDRDTGGGVYVDAHQAVAPSGRVLQVPELVSESLDDRLHERHEPVSEHRPSCTAQIQKMGRRPIRSPAPPRHAASQKKNPRVRGFLWRISRRTAALGLAAWARGARIRPNMHADQALTTARLLRRGILSHGSALG